MSSCICINNLVHGILGYEDVELGVNQMDVSDKQKCLVIL